jgi:EAL domain-containing protein (putative c-di-GMP-specific phosphodiesterase class I)
LTDIASLRFLVVEDHAFQRMLLVDMLHDLGARQVQEAADGLAALRILEEPAPSPGPLVVVCDLDMPGIDGIELLRIAAERRLAQGAILVSALCAEVAAGAAAMVRASGLTLVGNLRKPVSRARLAALLARQAPPPEPSAGDLDLSAEMLRGALAQRAFTFEFQPKVLLATGALVAVEALARWKHEGRAVPPSRFVPALARHGLLTELLFLTLERACDALRGWHAQGLRPAVCVNVSVSSLLDPGVVDRIEQVIAGRGLAPSSASLELTETEVMGDPVRVLGALSRLRLKGFDLAIDDFGRGYSSLQQLVDIPFTILKVDRAFTARCAGSTHVRRIVQSIIRLAHDLGRTVVAEGVEDLEAWSFLREERCDEAQGYFISPSLPPEQLRAWAWRWSEAMPDAAYRRQRP